MFQVGDRVIVDTNHYAPWLGRGAVATITEVHAKEDVETRYIVSFPFPDDNGEEDTRSYILHESELSRE
jgi:hypothetical protein